MTVSTVVIEKRENKPEGHFNFIFINGQSPFRIEYKVDVIEWYLYFLREARVELAGPVTKALDFRLTVI